MMDAQTTIDACWLVIDRAWDWMGTLRLAFEGANAQKW